MLSVSPSRVILYVLTALNMVGWSLAALYGWWTMFRDATPRGRVAAVFTAIGLGCLLWVTR